MDNKIQRGASRLPQPKTKKQKTLKPKKDYNKIFNKVVSTSIILLTFVLFYELWIYIAEPVINKPISNVNVISNSNEVDNQLIEKMISESVKGNSIFTIGAYSLIDDIKNVPWVKEVVFSRKYPDSIEISIEYQRAIARWGENQLLSDGNNIYPVSNIQEYSDLPIIHTSNLNKKNILNQYKVFNTVIKTLNHNIQSLIYSDNGSSVIILDNGVKINIGKENHFERLQNLIAIYNKEFVNNFNQIDYIDLRYRHGISVKLKETTEVVQTKI